MKRIKISEEVYNNLVSEDLTLTADLNSANGDIKSAVEKVKKDAQEAGVNGKNVNIQIPFNTNENIKKDTNILNINEFIKRL